MQPDLFPVVEECWGDAVGLAMQDYSLLNCWLGNTQKRLYTGCVLQTALFLSKSEIAGNLVVLSSASVAFHPTFLFHFFLKQVFLFGGREQCFLFALPPFFVCYSLALLPQCHGLL